MIFGEIRLVWADHLVLNPVMPVILQSHIPFDVTQPRPLPGMMVLDPEDWLWVDDAYGAQMALRRDLMLQRRDDVIACDARALPAVRELLEQVLQFIAKRSDFVVSDTEVVCPDGQRVALDWSDPLLCLGAIVQNDFCILQKEGDEHLLSAAVLCFPASWRLSNKFMCPLTSIHDTVAPYDDSIAKRVQRLFDAIRSDAPMWRFNALCYRDPELFQPDGHHSVQDRSQLANVDYVRSERQTLIRLPKTQAVVFGIHTMVVARESVGELPL